MLLARSKYVGTALEREMEVVPENLVTSWGWDGDRNKLVEEILFALFSLPGLPPKEGSPEWIKLILGAPAPPTFAQMVEYPALLKGGVKFFTKSFKDGRPVLKKHESVPDIEYRRDDEFEYLPVGFGSRSWCKHPQLKYLRKAPVLNGSTPPPPCLDNPNPNTHQLPSHTPAIIFLRNNGLAPFKTDASTMRDGKSVSNFTQVVLNPQNTPVSPKIPVFKNGYFSWLQNGYFSWFTKRVF